MQNLNQFPDEWDVAQHSYRDVGPAPEYQSPGGYYDVRCPSRTHFSSTSWQRSTDDDDRQAGALAAYSIVAAESSLGYYLPDASAEVAFDAGSAHPSSAFGFHHYLPPAAISKKYYALQDPNVYPADDPNASYTPSTATTAFDSASPSTTDSYTDDTLTVTSSPVPKLEEPPPAALHTTFLSSPSSLTTDASFILATPTPTPTPLASPTYYQDFRFQPTQGWHPAPSGPPESAYPVLPKQRRNRDDPGGDAGRLAQVCADELEVGPAPLCLGENVRLTRTFVILAGPDRRRRALPRRTGRCAGLAGWALPRYSNNDGGGAGAACSRPVAVEGRRSARPAPLPPVWGRLGDPHGRPLRGGLPGVHAPLGLPAHRGGHDA